MVLSFKNYKRIWFLLAILYFTAGYFLITWLNSTRTYYFNLGFKFEEWIPYIPHFILGYLLTYLCVSGLYFLTSDRVIFKKVLQLFFAVTSLHFFLFILIPVTMPLRPVIPPQSDLMNEMVKLYYWIDMPYNCFPSLHVAYTFMGSLILWNYKRVWSYIYLAATILVSFSVILVKQHYLLDVAGGYLTTILIYKLISPLSPKLADTT